MSEIRSGTEQDRDSSGRFTPGTSGNPSGRPPGIKDKRVSEREKFLGPILPEAVQQLNEAVKSGEKWAIELTISYSLPKPRAVDVDEMDEFEKRLTELETLTQGRH